MHRIALSIILSLVAANALAATATVTWTAPAQTITGAVTYNVYQGPMDNVVKIQSGVAGITATVTGLTLDGSTQCWAVTAVIAGVESALSPLACVTLNSAAPNAPGTPTVTIT